MVEKSASSGGAALLRATPCSANNTASIAAEFDKQRKTASAPSAASAGLAAGSAPASMSASSFRGVRFQTRTANPAASQRFAMGAPMSPVPMNAIVARLLVIDDFMRGSGAAAVRDVAEENSRDFLEH